MDAWEGRGTPLQISLEVTETLGTGPHEPTVSLSTDNGLNFAALGLGDGFEDPSTAFVASLDDANAAIAALTVHTTTGDGAVAASGVLSVGVCDSGKWVGDGKSAEGRTGWWDWGDGCHEEGWAEQNITFGYRMGTLPVIDGIWPVAAPIGGGLTMEVRVG